MIRVMVKHGVKGKFVLKKPETIYHLVFEEKYLFTYQFTSLTSKSPCPVMTCPVEYFASC